MDGFLDGSLPVFFPIFHQTEAGADLVYLRGIPSQRWAGLCSMPGLTVVWSYGASHNRAVNEAGGSLRELEAIGVP